MLNNGSLYGNYRTRTFSDIWKTFDEFRDEYNDSPLQNMSVSNLEILYYLLYARYGNSHIASSDENQFKYQVYATIFQYGPNWVKQLEVQTTLHNLTDNELTVGNLQIYNKALNPSDVTDVENNALINTINEQNTAVTRKGKVEAYAQLLTLLKTDVTGEFLNKFKKLFLTIVLPELPLWYETEEDID